MPFGEGGAAVADRTLPHRRQPDFLVTEAVHLHQLLRLAQRGSRLMRVVRFSQRQTFADALQ